MTTLKKIFISNYGEIELTAGHKWTVFPLEIPQTPNVFVSVNWLKEYFDKHCVWIDSVQLIDAVKLLKTIER